MTTPTSPPFQAPLLVGRERELRVLRQHLDAALAGQGSLVLISGEAGIGKTALAEVLCYAAIERGALVLIGRCYDLSETPPYGPWLEAIAHPALPANHTSFPAILAAQGSVIPATSQATLFQQLRDFVASISAQQPVVIMLEDLHWADFASLDLLRFLARAVSEMRLLILGIYRNDELGTEHPLTPLVPLLVHEARAHRTTVGPLSREAIGTMVSTRYSLPITDEVRLMDHLWTRTAGNCFFTVELLRALEEERVLDQVAGKWQVGDLSTVQVPSFVQQVIQQRLRRLGGETPYLLGLAAMIGRDISFALWLAVAAVNEETLLTVIERATQAHLLQETPEGTRTRFVHALVREALYAAISPTRRRLSHRAIGEALVSLPNPVPERVAFHFHRSGDPRAAAWYIRAGEQAQRSHARRNAAVCYEAALAALEEQQADVGQRGWLHYRIAATGQYTDHADALANLRRLEHARQLAEQAGDAVLVSYVDFDFGINDCVAGNELRGITLARNALAILEALPPADHQRMAEMHQQGIALGEDVRRGMLALSLSGTGHYHEAISRANPVISHDPMPTVPGAFVNSAHGDAYLALGIATFAHGQFEEAFAFFTKAREAYRSLGYDIPLAFCITLLFSYLPYLSADQYKSRWRQLATDGEDAWKRLDIQDTGYLSGLIHLWGQVYAGNWTEARRLAESAYRAGGIFRILAAQPLALVAYAQGNTDLTWQMVHDYFPEGTNTTPGDGWYSNCVALQRTAATLAIDEGDYESARAWLEAHDRWLAWSGALLGRSEGHLLWARYYRAVGEAIRAVESAQQSLNHATTPRQPLALLAAHRLLGELDTDAARFTDAESHLNAALALADACAAPYERALTLLALAALRGATGDHPAALVLLDEARAICTPLGAMPALARADAIAARLATATAPSQLYPDDLTPREVDVLRLIAQGRSNREIAATLFISSRTVNRHIENLYRKIGAHGKADATAYAFRHHLT